MRIFIFLAVWISIYGSLHAYMLWRVHSALPRARLLLIALCLFSALMVFGPIVVRQIENADYHVAARIAAWIAYAWMGFVTWFFFCGLIGEIWNGGVRLGGLVKPGVRMALVPPVHLLVGLVFLAVLFSVLGIWGALRIRLKTVKIPTASLAADAKPIRIVQISDVHLGLLVREGRLKKILDLVREARPDAFVCTGDLVDASLHGIHDIAQRMLNDVDAPLGKYAVLGNHEYYAHLPASLAFIRGAGFRLLRGESELAGGRLRIVGVDDPASGLGKEALESRERELLAKDRRDSLPVVLLKHRPDVLADSVGKMDLQVSGHTHGGQMLPPGFFVWLGYAIWPGLHGLGDGSSLYLSRGTATWGPPMRVFAPPEVTVLVLEPER